jgi:phosphoribosylformimino-5-aminoimidazole carboxamide ribotide isomerase
MITIIPAIDIIEGKCVRLSQGDYSQKTVYSEDPLEVAKMFEDAGIKRLHLVDLEGAKAQQVINIKVLELIASNTNLHIDFGGGIKSTSELKMVFNCGAHQATIGSLAVTNRDMVIGWLEIFGAEKIILGADVKDSHVAITGWLDVTKIKVVDFIKSYNELGLDYVLCTDISKDGMLQGTSIELYEKLIDHFPDLNIIASGGITEIKEIENLQEMGIYGVIVGKAIYEGKITLDQLKLFLE